MERRLAAILVADIVGYSRLMGLDEEGTIARQRSHHQEVIAPQFAAHRGRIVKSTGDGILAEFPSVVDAVKCAVETQRALADLENGVPEDRQILYRVGVNLGDIVVDGDDILGDGVNVAARLEGLAKPGGICIGRNVQDQIRDKLQLSFEDMGEVEVKNIARPVRAFRIVMDDEVQASRPHSVVATTKPVSGRRAIIFAVVTAMVLALAATAVWWQPWGPNVRTVAKSQRQIMHSDKPSVAVLPFTNISGDKEQDYFAEGMAEDIITDLSKLSALFVIGSKSSFRYKGPVLEVRQVGQELGVQYLLQGSVRRAGDQVRINAQLIDAITGGQIWAERYDAKFSDTFALQDKVTSQIIRALSIELGAEEKAKLADKGTTNIQAHDAFLKGQSHARRFTSDDAALAIKYYEKALSLDPSYNRAAEALRNMRFIRENSGFR